MRDVPNLGAAHVIQVVTTTISTEEGRQRLKVPDGRSACMERPTSFSRDDHGGWLNREIAGWFHGVFGDRYFIEVQNNGLEVQRQALELSVEVANRMGLPSTASSGAT